MVLLGHSLRIALRAAAGSTLVYTFRRCCSDPTCMGGRSCARMHQARRRPFRAHSFLRLWPTAVSFRGDHGTLLDSAAIRRQRLWQSRLVAAALGDGVTGQPDIHSIRPWTMHSQASLPLTRRTPRHPAPGRTSVMRAARPDHGRLHSQASLRGCTWRRAGWLATPLPQRSAFHRRSRQ